MSLKEYHKKRSFTKTPEPEGRVHQSSETLMFVIQKHNASKLHYDFRLELNGVLKSWAIPKGPSLNPKDKHLAIMVEDHPMEYAHFEGIIPKDNYGAGTVMVWDTGVYLPYGAKSRDDAEKILNKQLHSGHITIILLGEKLKGEYALIKTHRKDDKSWIIVKKGDEFASSTKNILNLDKSVLTKRTMYEIKYQSAKNNDVWENNSTNISINNLPVSKLSHHIKPMLAKTADKPFNDPKWVFEIKYDGYRAIAEIESGKVRLYSRNNLDFTEKFKIVTESLSKFRGNAIFDGEIVVVDSLGHPHFQWLQDYHKGTQGELIYYVFDILYYNGKNIEILPLLKRKQLLKQILPSLPHIKYCSHIEKAGIAMYEQAKDLGLEGIMAKNSESTYAQGERSGNWLKIKTQHRQEFVIAGFTEPKGSRKYFGSIIAGIYQQKKLKYIGHVGGGFDDAGIEKLYKKLNKLKQKSSPFNPTPQTNTPATWTKPLLVGEATFSGWTKDNQMRHPVFVGLREDKYPSEVTTEISHNKNDDNTTIQLGKQTLTLTHLKKVFFPQEKYTKGDLISFYREIAPVILPYLVDRPESLLRYPNGIAGESFYQKDASLLHENWLAKTLIHSDSNNKNISYLLCQDEATLIYLINLGCIDLNPWSSRVGQIENPDYLIIDLDPEKTDFSNVIKTALKVREVLEKLDIPSYPKISGAKGFHIYIPLGAKYSYDQSRQLAQLLCWQVHTKIPDITSMERSPKKRQGLVYLDYLQNRHGQTLASVYSVRPQKGAPVSTPLNWSEVTKKLHPSQFTIKNVPQRIQKHGDLFKPVLGKGINIEKVLKSFQN